MKIIAGLYKGTNLFSPTGADIRPALARLKNSLFNILAGRLEGQSVLDLFAGSGSLGFEALSRGAQCCLFIDNQRACVDAMEKTSAKLKLTSQARIMLMDSFGVIPYAQRTGDKFDCVFVDPPYKYYDGEPDRAKIFGVITGIAEQGILAKGGIIIVEHRSRRTDEAALNQLGLLERFDLRNYGQTSLSFLMMKI